MEFATYAALILLSAVGYAAGAALRAGNRQVEPGLLDLLGQAVVWTGAILSRSVWGWNRWLAILFWLAAGMACGALTSRPRVVGRKIPGEEANNAARPKQAFGRAWAAWKRFSRRMGNFQSRMILSWMYFLVISPVGLIRRTFSDPLNIKKKKEASHWVPRKDTAADLEAAKRQY